MYKSFYHLKTNPFGTSPDPRYLYMMPHTREALAGLQYGISARKGFLVLTGEVGTGKTTLLRSAIESFEKQIHSSFVFNPRLDTLDFLEFVLSDFGLTPASRTKSGLLLQLNRWLIECYRRQETCVIVVDEAQNLTWELMEEIRLLTNLETSSEKLVQIILCGQPELEQKLRQSSVRQLRQRIFLWCRTQPISAEQTQAYIEQRLAIGGTTDSIFQPDAVALIHRASRGIPRIINLICENALISGYVEQVHRIRAPLIADVVADLDLDGSSFAASGHTGDPFSAGSFHGLDEGSFEEPSSKGESPFAASPSMRMEPEEPKREPLTFSGSPIPMPAPVSRSSNLPPNGPVVSTNGFASAAREPEVRERRFEGAPVAVSGHAVAEADTAPQAASANGQPKPVNAFSGRAANPRSGRGKGKGRNR